MLRRLVRKLGRGSSSKERTSEGKAEVLSPPCLSPTTGLDNPGQPLELTESVGCNAPMLEARAEAQAGSGAPHHSTPTLAFAAAQATGCRERQEDRYCLHPQLVAPASANDGSCSCSRCPATEHGHEDGSKQATSTGLHFFAVYDGHGGSDVAQHCADHLHEHLRNLLPILHDNTCSSACLGLSNGQPAAVQRQTIQAVSVASDSSRAILDHRQSYPGEAPAVAPMGVVARPTSWHAGDCAAYVGAQPPSSPHHHTCRSQGSDMELTHSLSEVDCSKHEHGGRRQWHKRSTPGLQQCESTPASCSCTGLDHLANTTLARSSDTSSNSNASNTTPSTQISPVGSSVLPCSPTHLQPIIESSDWAPSSISTPAAYTQQAQQQDSRDKQWPGPPAATRMEQALARAFLQVDAEVCGRAASEQGCTAVVALLSAHHLWVANCGDSRAVLVRDQGGSVVLSADHKASRADEVARIQAAGGFVWWNRVMGELAVSRAIGDHSLRPFVIAEPEVTHVQRTAADRLLLLASDGLWDVVSSQEASEIAMATLCAYRNAGRSMATCVRKVAAALSGTALTRGSKDNITVVVVDVSCGSSSSTPRAHHDMQHVAGQPQQTLEHPHIRSIKSVSAPQGVAAGLPQTVRCTPGSTPGSTSSPCALLHGVLPGSPVRSKPVSSIFPLAQPDWTDWPDNDTSCCNLPQHR